MMKLFKNTGHLVMVEKKEELYIQLMSLTEHISNFEKDLTSKSNLTSKSTKIKDEFVFTTTED